MMKRPIYEEIEQCHPADAIDAVGHYLVAITEYMDWMEAQAGVPAPCPECGGLRFSVSDHNARGWYLMCRSLVNGHVCSWTPGGEHETPAAAYHAHYEKWRQAQVKGGER